MNDFRMVLYPYTVSDDQKQYAVFIESSHVKPFIGTKFGDVMFFYFEEGGYYLYLSEGYDRIKIIGIDGI